MRIRPLVGSSKPDTIRSVVVLPHPDGPSSEMNSRGFTSKSTESTATVLPNRLVTPWRVTEPRSGRSPVEASLDS